MKYEQCSVCRVAGGMKMVAYFISVSGDPTTPCISSWVAVIYGQLNPHPHKFICWIAGHNSSDMHSPLYVASQSRPTLSARLIGDVLIKHMKFE